MELVPIGEAARRLGMNASALRYYEERGLVRPAGRVGGKRVYDSDALRRVAFARAAQRLGVRLDTVAAVLDADSEEWRRTVTEQIHELDLLIERARGAREFLSHALGCPADHPARECVHMTGFLDRLVAGTPFDEIAAAHTGVT